MRLAIVLVLAGCHAAAPLPKPGAIDLHVAAAGPSPGAVAISTGSLHFVSVSAVSDRAPGDPRAQAGTLDLALGASADRAFEGAPPGLYSAVAFQLGTGNDDGVNVMGAWTTKVVHALISGPPVVARCAGPAEVAAGQRVKLTLTTDPAHWFDTIDLAQAASDPDDTGIVISDDDNPQLARELFANVAASFALDCAAE